MCVCSVARSCPTLCNSMDWTVQWWCKKLCKGDGSPEDEERKGRPLGVDHDQLKATTEGDLLTTFLQLHKQLLKNSTSTILQSFGIKQIGMVKNTINGCLVSWPKIKKSSLWSVIFSYSAQQRNISWLDCDMQRRVDFIQLVMCFPKPNLHQNKVMVTVVPIHHGGLLLGWSTTVFWIPLKPLYLRSTLSKSMRCTKNCNACSQHWSTGQTNSPWQCLTVCRTTNTSKVEWIGLRSFASSAIFT